MMQLQPGCEAGDALPHLLQVNVTKRVRPSRTLGASSVAVVGSCPDCVARGSCRWSANKLTVSFTIHLLFGVLSAT